MEFLKSIKWYHVIIICLVGVVAFLIITSNQSKCKIANENAPSNQEGFNNNSNSKINGQNEIILYYATWCGYSRMILPEWEKFEKYAKDNLKNIKVSSFKCEGGDEKTCVDKGIQGYPTIILIKSNGDKIQYDGERTVKGLIDFCSKY